LSPALEGVADRLPRPRSEKGAVDQSER
jgi:hypothetical protein